MAQVAAFFIKKKEVLGAKEAAKVLHVCRASFYKYAAGTDLPSIETLKLAQEHWGFKPDLIDPSEIIKRKIPKTFEQYTLPFLKNVEERNIVVEKVRVRSATELEVRLKISFTA
jgi:hypothetical protein